MRCTLAEQLIPLFIGDDLPAEDTAALRAHLDECAACRQQAAGFAASRDWLRANATPAFSDAAMENLRDAVHRQIADAARQRTWYDALLPNWELRFKTGFALAAAAILLAAVIGLPRGRRQSERSAPFVAATEATPDAPGPTVPERKHQRPVRDRGRPRPETKPRLRSLKPEPPAAPEPALVAANHPPANPEMLRIEMQTADPNIRIIWFAPKMDSQIQPITK